MQPPGCILDPAIRNATTWLHLAAPLLVLTPPVTNPAGWVMPARIAVSPVHHTALPVPLIFAGKLDGRAGPQSIDPWGKVEVICDQHRLPGWQANDEPLMPGALRIVSQHLGDDPVSADFDAARVIAVGRGECIFVAGVRRMLTGLRLRLGLAWRDRPVEHPVLQGQGVDDAQQAQKSDQFSHSGGKCTQLLRQRRR
jgi:hypothetical protein